MNEKKHNTSLWLVIIVSLVVSLTSTIGYDYFKRHREQQAHREAVEKLERERAVAAKEAAEQQMREQAVAAEAMKKTRLRQSIDSVSSIKGDVTEYYANKGELPRNRKDIGLPGDWVTDDWLQHIDIYADGSIELHFTPESGQQGKVVRLRPQIEKKDETLGYWNPNDWECTSSIPNIAEIKEGCRYVP